ncbi:RxLR-like protein [Plasmopara halstedii]|uniref:RxLR-like protein n=1 Tax=Plasmopara halstedii TaxID=4781 RepID=A0A0P1AJQ2_PLAHL|nr:RxLR-like protein [Plasmopara halstedii]CEG41212.1 RxLR-like protein [Plasmopara halstedii]|eukprot:XP_024577581.1 RxLR-like protein [Plasmopara halstedii]
MRLSMLTFIVTLSSFVQKHDAFSSSTNSDKSRVTPLISDIEHSANVPAELFSGWKAQDSQHRRLKPLDQVNPADHSKNAAKSIDEEDTTGVKERLPQLKSHHSEKKQRRLVHKYPLFSALKKNDVNGKLSSSIWSPLAHGLRRAGVTGFKWNKLSALLKRRNKPSKITPM